jgi:hypothetical protein
MQFSKFKAAVQRRLAMMKDLPLFCVAVDKDALWALYLASFPEGSNPMFRQRTEHDCSCCRQFIKTTGSMVAVSDGKIISLFDVEVEGPYQVVADAMADFVKKHPISNIFLHYASGIGTTKNFEETEGNVRTWEHFHIQLPSSAVVPKIGIGPRLSEAKASHDVLLRSLTEITPEAVDTVLEIIEQGSLYRGEEKKAVVTSFRDLQRRFVRLKTEQDRDIFAWVHSQDSSAFVARIRNDVIGTLLTDISEGLELESAVKRFEDKVAPTNYKRTSALITPRMKEQAKEKLKELGLIPALERRYATLRDISVENLLFADRNARRTVSEDVFDNLPTKGADARLLDKVEEIGVDAFLTQVLPKAKTVEVLFENRQTSNLVTLVTAVDASAPLLFKWNNQFSWSYNGDVADSLARGRVKQAGGNVDGDVCCRLAWYNTDDQDLHMREPGGSHISYVMYRRTESPCGGMLDVDANGCDGIRPDPVENIVYADRNRMKVGTYTLSVHQYSKRQGKDEGFEAEIDVMGTVYHFTYSQPLRHGETKEIARIIVARDRTITVEPVLSSSQSVKEVWGLKTQTFHAVQAIMLSPNFWSGQGTGNRHFFFMIDGCKNPGSARGFYNEFLRSELEPHRKTMEIVGSKMRTENEGEQLSGLGFSSTQRNYVLCRVKGAFTRTVKVMF